ncbi:hypothetical protein GYMLUDRAFT_177198, partial [Collybiopsis luxurians FD-317 M1]
LHLLQEIYDRCVKPKHHILKAGKGDTTYGELMPVFLERLFQMVNLDSDSLFIDLGSGTGNTLAQAALTRGCRAFGIELRTDVATIANRMLKAAIIRSEIWGIPIGKTEAICGDMLNSIEVISWIKAADCVLINNRIFDSSLNEKIKSLIKNMKPGAVLVSLKSYQVCSMNRSGRIRPGSKDVGLMFEVSEHGYSSGDVSWSSEEGVYYIHRKIF